MTDIERIRSMIDAILADMGDDRVERQDLAVKVAASLSIEADAAAGVLNALHRGAQMFVEEFSDPDDPYTPSTAELCAFMGLLLGDRIGWARAVEQFTD